MERKEPSSGSKNEEAPKIDAWAAHEFGRTGFEDKRLEKRLKKIGTNFARQPNASIPQASGNWAGSKGAYRFFDNEEVTAQEILGSHRLATLERMGGQELVFAIQDTSSLNYSGRSHTTGLGPISNNADKTMGLFAHTTLVVNRDGVPQGIIHAQIQARDGAKYGDSKRRNTKTLEEKESVRWMESFRATQEAAGMLVNTRVISVADREGDIYELLALAKEKENQVGLLVRAQHNRGVAHEEKRLWKFLRSQPVSAKLAVEVPGGPGKRLRTAILSIRFSATMLKAPLLKSEKAPIEVWAIEACEENVSSGVTPLCWKLLTSVPVITSQDAIERVQWYKLRWQIEVFHKILKSGCKIEERLLETAQRLKNCAAVDMVVAWRILYLTTQSRHTPDAPASCILLEHEWKALYCFFHHTHKPPAQAPGMRQATRWIAQLGGFLARKGDGDPGPITLWRGLQRLDDIATAFLAFNPLPCG